MTLLRARCSVRRERLLRERPFSIRSRRGCSPVSTLRLDSSGERPNSSLSGISKEPVQTKSLQMAVITEINGASSSAAGTELQITRKRTYKKRAKKNARNKVDSPQWGDLPPELLALIAERVAIPGFFSLAHVSRAFRASALSVKREFLGSKGPLVAVITSRATRSCFFFDLKARTAYRTKLQKFCRRICIGISSGFLILQSRASGLMLTNPMTSRRVNFPQMLPYFYTRPVLSDKCIFAYTMPRRRFLAVAVCTAASSIQFCRSGDSEWSFLSYENEFWSIRDIITFESRIYALMDSAHIGVLSLRSPPKMQVFHIKDRPYFSPCAKLVVSGDELLAADFIMGAMFRIYRVDFAGSQWVRVLNLGDRSLFLSELKSSRICSTASWGGRVNSIYYLGYQEECLVYSATNPPVLIDRFPITPGNKGRAAKVWYGWYMPNEALKIDCVWDDRYPPPVAPA